MNVRDGDTGIGGPRDRFPETRRSRVLAIRSDDPSRRSAALQDLVAAYWKPVYKYLRLRWKADNETAKDWTQGYFASGFERGLLERYDPARGPFRHYVRLSVDGFVQNELKAAARLKRGGGEVPLSLDFESAEGELRAADVPAGPDPEACFEREWTRTLFGLALTELSRRLTAAGRSDRLALFERYDLDDADDAGYDDLAREFGIPVTQVTNHLAAARREFRKILLENLRAITAGEEEFRSEARRLFGDDPR